MPSRPRRSHRRPRMRRARRGRRSRERRIRRTSTASAAESRLRTAWRRRHHYPVQLPNRHSDRPRSSAPSSPATPSFKSHRTCSPGVVADYRGRFRKRLNGRKKRFGIILPNGAFNMILGDHEAGDIIVRHPSVRCLSFTGSKSVGDAVDAVASGLGKRVMKEVGGVNIFYVHAEADIDRAARNFVYGKTITAGQRCARRSRKSAATPPSTTSSLPLL